MRRAPQRSAYPWRKPPAEWDRRPLGVKRETIIEVGTRLLAEHGLDGMSLNAMMRLTGIERSVQYRFYPTKADIVQEIAGIYLGRIYKALDSVGLDDMSEPKRLGVMARALARAAHRRPDEHRVLMMGLASLPVDARLALRTRLKWLHAGLAEAVGQRLPDLDPAAAEERAAQLMLLLAGPPLWAAERDEAAVDAAADAAVAAVTVQAARRRRASASPATPAPSSAALAGSGTVTGTTAA